MKRQCIKLVIIFAGSLFLKLLQELWTFGEARVTPTISILWNHLQSRKFPLTLFLSVPAVEMHCVLSRVTCLCRKCCWNSSIGMFAFFHESTLRLTCTAVCMRCVSIRGCSQDPAFKWCCSKCHICHWNYHSSMRLCRVEVPWRLHANAHCMQPLTCLHHVSTEWYLKMDIRRVELLGFGLCKIWLIVIIWLIIIFFTVIDMNSLLEIDCFVPFCREQRAAIRVMVITDAPQQLFASN